MKTTSQVVKTLETAVATPQVLGKAALNEIVPSKTNPRKAFNGVDWPDFVANIKEHGVLQPILVRPSPKGFPDGVKYELIAGERRWRAARDAKLMAIPVIVQEVTDAAAVEIQQIENLQREDLSPLEEAQGYDAWRKTLVQSGSTQEAAIEHICARTNRKRTVVYQRLALLTALPAVLDALSSGRLDISRATLAASVPDPVRQRNFLMKIVEMSFREARELLEEEYQRPLKSAPFDIAMEYGKDLMKGGGYAGGCGGCPHRSGNLTAVSPESAKNPNICTNVACFERKKEIHTAQVLAQAKRDNKAVVDPKVYSQRSYNYVPPDRICYEAPGGKKSWGELAKKAGITPSVTVDETEGIVEVFTLEQLTEIKKRAGIKERGSSRGGAADTAAEKKRKAKNKAMTAVLAAAVPAILEKLVPKGKLDVRLFPLLASAAYDRCSIDRHDFMAKRLGISKSQNETRDKLTEHFEKHGSPAESAVLLVELLLLSCTGYSPWASKTEWDERALEAAKLAGIDLSKRLEKYEAEVAQQQKGTKKKGGKK